MEGMRVRTVSMIPETKAITGESQWVTELVGWGWHQSVATRGEEPRTGN